MQDDQKNKGKKAKRNDIIQRNPRTSYYMQKIKIDFSSKTNKYLKNDQKMTESDGK